MENYKAKLQLTRKTKVKESTINKNYYKQIKKNITKKSNTSRRSMKSFRKVTNAGRS